MMTTLDDVEFETRTIGSLVLTTPVLRHLGLAEIIDRYCPVAEQADMGHGVVAEMVVQCRLTEPLALYDMADWAERYGMAALYDVLARAEQLNDDRIGRMLDSIYDRRAVIWGELIGRAARVYELEGSGCSSSSFSPWRRAMVVCRCGTLLDEMQERSQKSVLCMKE